MTSIDWSQAGKMVQFTFLHPHEFDLELDSGTTFGSN
jgi:hypothetical protein